DSWVKGEIEGNKVTFRSGQYVGLLDECFQYFCVGIDTPEFIPGYEEWLHHYTLAEAVTMDYDEIAGVLRAVDPNDALLINSGTMVASPFEVYRNATLKSQPLEVSLVPATPEFRKGENEFNNGFAGCDLSFLQRPFNKDGQYIDPSRLGFSIYSDNEVYVFKTQDYWTDEDMTVIPWGYTNWWTEFYNNGFTILSIDEYVSALTIRAVYTDGENVYYSDVLNPLKPENSVTFISGEESEPIYFDISGRKVTDPQADGIYIKVMNGKVSKVIK
ncbi:MAG: hypothetical protein K2H75_04850, partial [Muribaculaceae bacterium]|nr:hypothetical protein [Muribaculaceae bacterium]